MFEKQNTCVLRGPYVHFRALHALAWIDGESKGKGAKEPDGYHH